VNDRLPLRRDETQLDGAWVKIDGVVNADNVELRIISLTDTQLEKVADTADGWSTLLRDPQDERLWELTFPQSGEHGGGPKRLALISSDDARARYRLPVADTD
jgi:Immunity protein 27